MRRFALLLADDVFGRDTLLGIDNRKPDVTAAVRSQQEAELPIRHQH